MNGAERALIRELRDLEARLELLRVENRRLENELAWANSRGSQARIIKSLQNRFYAQRERAELWKHRALRND